MDNLIRDLRDSRQADDVLSKLRAGSLEARRERIAEALRNEDWKDPFTGESYAPAELLATYPDYAIATKDGALLKIYLEETESQIKLGKVEIHDLPISATTIGEEVIETARTAVDSILSEQDPTLMLKSITKALDIKGDLQHRIECDLSLRALDRNPWWLEVINESFNTEIALPTLSPTKEDFNILCQILKTEEAETKRATARLQNPIFAECGRDVSEDIMTAITLLNGVNFQDSEEVKRVFETVERVTPRLLKAAKFLVNLST